MTRKAFLFVALGFSCFPYSLNSSKYNPFTRKVVKVEVVEKDTIKAAKSLVPVPIAKEKVSFSTIEINREKYRTIIINGKEYLYADNVDEALRALKTERGRREGVVVPSGIKEAVRSKIFESERLPISSKVDGTFYLIVSVEPGDFM